jgi:conjugal transfer mating pair stabilization protein TraG
MPYGYEIITYGGGETLTLLFNGIATVIGDSNYTTMIRLTATLGLFWVLLESTFRNSFALNAKWLIGFILLYNVLLVPKVTVHIIDRVQHDQIQAVDHVPWGLAIFASLSSEIGDTLTHLCEKTFSLPDDLRYGKTGTVMASSLMSAATRFEITNPDFAKNMRSFMQQCVFYDVLLGKYTVQELMSTPDLWGFVTASASPARAFVYVDTAGHGQIQTCKVGSQRLTQDWKTELGQASVFYGHRLFPQAKTPQEAKAYLLSSLNEGYQYLTQISEDTAQTMQQAMMANAVEQNVIGQAAEVNAPAAVHAYAVIRANNMKRTTYQITGELAARWIPLMKNVFEALLYGAFLFIFLVTLLPMGAATLKTYVMSLFWLQTWAPLYAILNLIMTLDARSHSLAETALNDGGHALTLTTLSGLSQANADTAALAGYLSMSIPFIAYSIVKGGASTFTQLAGSISSAGQSAASTAANEATTGNFSLGNTHLSTHTANNTSANHWNTNASIESGMTSYQTATGAMVHHTSAGYDVIDNRGTTISHTATSVNIADSLRSSATQHYEQSITAAQNASENYGNAISTALRGVYDLSSTQGKTTSSDDSSTLSQSASISSSIQTTKELTDRFAKDHGLTTSQATQILGTAQASLNLGLPSGVGPSAGIRGELIGTSRAERSETFRAAEDYVTSTRFGETLEKSLRGVHDQHFRTSTDDGQRLAHSISTASDHAESYRKEASASLQQANSYRSAMNMTSEQAASMNQLASQQFVEWMQQQPAPGNTTGRMGATTVDHILNHEPTVARNYANDFIRTQSTNMLQQWSHTDMPQHVKENYAQDKQLLTPAHTVDDLYQKQSASIQEQANHSGLSKKHIFNASIASNAENMIADTNGKILSEGATVNQAAQSIQSAVNLTTDKSHHDLLKKSFKGAGEALMNITKNN